MFLKKWFPNVVTLLLAAILILTQRVWAGPLADRLTAPTGASSRTTIAYQGYLTNATGSPANDALVMIFRLYNVESGGVALWSETQPAVQVTNGLFSVLLGSVTPLSSSLIADNSDLWLGITVGSDTEMAPRDKLASAPYAMMADVPDGSITQYKLGNDSVTSAKIVDDAVTSSDVGFNYAGSTSKGGAATDVACSGCIAGVDIQDGQVASSDIADNAITSAKIQDGQVTSGDIADNTLTEDDIADGFVARNSDALDGYHSNNLPYAAPGHVHDDRYFTEWESDSRYAGSGHVHDDRYFTGGESDNRFVNAGGDTMAGTLIVPVLGSPINTNFSIDAGAGSFNKLYLYDDVEIGNELVVKGAAITFNGRDFVINAGGDRGDGGRALVHDFNDTLTLNYNHDFAGGVLVHNLHTSSIVEQNLMTPEQDRAVTLLEFQPGDILCWNDQVDQLEKCDRVAAPLVVAVASDQGKPMTFGVEPVKAIGPIRPGDLLVASDVPGYAIAWSEVGTGNPPAGIVIAKALGEIREGESGTVKAMIMIR